MKLQTLLPPVIALTIAGTWLGSQRREIFSLEQESAILQKAIVAHSASSSTDSSTSKAVSTTQAAKDREPLDWKKIAAELAEMQGDGDMRGMMKLQQRLQALSKEELIAALDEIAALDLPKASRAMLEQLLIGPLAAKDPELVLTRFIDRLHENGHFSISWQLASAMQQWAKKDAASAIAWFDQQIAAGKFEGKSLDGKSQPRLQFETNLIHLLLGTDPDAAGRRLAALPEDQRSDALRFFFHEPLKEEDQAAFAKLVRDQIPQHDQAQTLSQKASTIAQLNGGYLKVTEFLDRIQATPAERTACVEQAAKMNLINTSHQKKITRDDLNTMREWVTSQVPESTDKVTGTALANASQNGRKMKFAEAAELAMEYNTAAGNDEVLSTFLEGWPARQNKEQARVLADKISDPKRREQILKNLE